MSDTRRMLEHCLFDVLDVVYGFGYLGDLEPEQRVDLIEDLVVGTLVQVRDLARKGEARHLDQARLRAAMEPEDIPMGMPAQGSMT